MMALYVGNNTARVGESNKWAVVLGRHGFLNSFRLLRFGHLYIDACIVVLGLVREIPIPVIGPKILVHP